jgi:hypothetical protein
MDFSRAGRGERNAAGRNPMFTTKDTKITKKNRTICHIQYFVSFVFFVVKKFCREIALQSENRDYAMQLIAK